LIQLALATWGAERSSEYYPVLVAIPCKEYIIANVIAINVLQGSVATSLVSLERVSALGPINSRVLRNLTSQESRNDPTVDMSFENNVCSLTILQVAPRWADSESDR
jgi:hypothetical protein